MAKDDITRMLERAAHGDDGSLGALWQATYGQVHAMASAAYRHESDTPTLQPTALVSEVYLRLYGNGTPPVFENRRHFFGAVARSLGQVLIDHARRRDRAKRGGGERPASLALVEHELSRADRIPTSDLERLMEALKSLEGEQPRAAEVTWLRFVTGLSDSEVAGILGVSRRTVQNDWLFAKALLRRELGIEPPSGE